MAAWDENPVCNRSSILNLFACLHGRSAWDSCDKSCGGGEQQRHRQARTASESQTDKMRQDPAK